MARKRIFNMVNITGLRKTHFEQLLIYLENREREGLYYGNKKQFEKRHEELKIWIEKIINTASKKDVSIPKKN